MQQIIPALIASLTLGLAPFVPEPHIVKQLRNLFSGNLTQAIDIFDLLMHGAPWIWLFVAIAMTLAAKAKKQ